MRRSDPISNLIEDVNLAFGRERTRQDSIERIAQSLEKIADCFVRLLDQKEGTIQ
jgi:hypothetical protein